MAEVEFQKRWRVSATYRANDYSLIGLLFEIDELEELQEIVESGPNWYALEGITVTHNMSDRRDTIESMAAE